MVMASYPAGVPPTLTAEQVNTILDQRAYRPGWQFRAYTGETTRAVIVEVLATVPDSYRPGLSVPLEVYCPVPAYVDDELAFDKWLAWRLQRLEVHESQEWYRRPGRDQPMVPVFNPHRDGADRDQWPIVKRDHR
jgi:hypothetical protein